MPWQRRHVTRVGDVRIAWLEAGPSNEAVQAADPVVLVHGLGTSDRWWTPAIPTLAERRRVLAVNLVGFGRSGGQPVRLDVAADQLAAWARSIGLDRAAWVGHSMGGLVTTDLAARHPDVVDRLVLVCAAGLPISHRVTRHLINMLRSGPRLPAAAYPVAIECVLRCGPLAIMRASHQILATDLRGRLGRIAAPTLVVWGAHDRLLSPSFGRRLAAAIPDASYVEISGAGHSPMWERPTEFVRLLDDFLAGPREPRRPVPSRDLEPALAAGVSLTAPTGGRIASRYLALDGSTIHVRVGRPDDASTARDTTPIVFVHGYGLASRAWLPTMARLARRHLVVAPDLPGFGWSATSTPARDIQGMGGAVLSIMDAAGIDRTMLVGTSLGSQVIAQLAADHPDRVLGVVLVGPTFDPSERTALRQLIRFLAAIPGEWPSAWLERARDLALAGPGRVLATLRLGWRHRIEHVLPEVRVPALVVRGGRDALITRRWARTAAALLPNARAIEIRGTAGTVGRSTPDALAEVIEEHVLGAEAAARLRPDGVLPIPLVTAAHRRRPTARPRRTRAGPPRA